MHPNSAISANAANSAIAANSPVFLFPRSISPLASQSLLFCSLRPCSFTPTRIAARTNSASSANAANSAGF